MQLSDQCHESAGRRESSLQFSTAKGWVEETSCRPLLQIIKKESGKSYSEPQDSCKCSPAHSVFSVLSAPSPIRYSRNSSTAGTVDKPTAPMGMAPSLQHQETRTGVSTPPKKAILVCDAILPQSSISYSAPERLVQTRYMSPLVLSMTLNWLALLEF